MRTMCLILNNESSFQSWGLGGGDWARSDEDVPTSGQEGLEAQNMRNSKLKIRNSKSTGLKPAFTLVEVLIVVAILAVVAVGLVGVSGYLQTQSSIALTEKCVELLSTAVAEFYDITGHYPVDNWTVTSTDSTCRIYNAVKTGGTRNPAPDELLYLQLSLLPQTREIISKLPNQLLAKPLDPSNNLITVTLAGQTNPTPYLRSIVDPWGEPLDYDTSGSYPVIQSGGPDGDLATTEDNISNAD